MFGTVSTKASKQLKINTNGFDSFMTKRSQVGGVDSKLVERSHVYKDLERTEAQKT
jgi:hypothetical protein